MKKMALLLMIFVTIMSACTVKHDGKNINSITGNITELNSVKASPVDDISLDDGLKAFVEGDFTKAKRSLKPFAEKGNPAAQTTLGLILLTEDEAAITSNNNAIEWLTLAAKQNEVIAQFVLGTSYFEGEGVSQNYAEAAKWWKEAARNGYRDAQYNLGTMYKKGQGVKKDWGQAVYWFRLAADQGLAEAQFVLGKAYDFGQNVEKNLLEAEKYYRKAAEQEHVEAQFNLGTMYERGDGTVQNFEESAKWYLKAAENGYAPAQYNLGVYYYEGKGVPKNHEKMLHWWEMAASQGHSDAQEWLDVIYPKMVEEGINAFKEENFKWAYSLLGKAAHKGYAEAQVKLGQMYARGDYVAQDDKNAFEWFSRAAIQGNAQGLELLGMMYLNGRGVEEDFERGFNLIAFAAVQGSPKAAEVIEKKFRGFRLAMKGPNTLLFVSEPSITGSDGKKWFWSKQLKFGFDNHNFLDFAVETFDTYNIVDCDRGLCGIKQIRDVSIPYREIEMMSFPPGSAGSQMINHVCKNKDQQSKPFSKNIASSGTGWVIPSGYIATNLHVVDGHENITVINSNGEKFHAIIVSKDVVNDLALLKVENGLGVLAALPLANRPCVSGEEVFTIGYPHPEIMGTEAKITSGIVNSSRGLQDDPRMLQISVPVQAGNSGGPLVNSKGEVVGVVTSKLGAMRVFSETGDMPQNVNYAIKAKYLSPLLDGLKKRPTVNALAAQKTKLSDLAIAYRGSVFLVVAE
ncbi:MAG: trypsin-like peptidase domain-containing protein [Thiomonas sp.]|uniref:trypsin-like peptidase domain-containing protein n=1 Tax=Thiomonas sp. TaxID=2047785 RepID=UPI002A36ECE3|nr:trypsin-like peptidase domain-containing protein [Thiomonas sp.]MDY0331800.1 trypsin-like peptidase domain-containing protein [Thiomonas sp.]